MTLRTRIPFIGAAALLVLDGVLLGSFLNSLFICPIWLVVSGVRSVIPPFEWRGALMRGLIPILTLGLVLSNAAVQSRVAQSNAEKVIGAAEAYRRDVGTYPGKLSELTPRYLASVPRAKYALVFGDFWYFSTSPTGPRRPVVARAASDRHTLMWVALPPFGRRVYVFEEERWDSLD